MKPIFRGDVLYADLGQHVHSTVQSGVRPCVVVSNNTRNKYADRINVCPCTTKDRKKDIFGRIKIMPKDVMGYLEKSSWILIDQITTIDKKKIISKTGHVRRESEIMEEIDFTIRKQLGIECNE